MYDPAPFLSLVDASSELEMSSVSATTSVTSNRYDRLEKLEREVVNLTRRLDEEAAARRKLQDTLADKPKPIDAE